MALRSRREENARLIAEGRFIAKVLRETSLDIDAEINKRMNAAAFKSAFWQDKAYEVKPDGDGGKLQYRHKKQHRFVDMKKRKTKTGSVRKKSYPIHNKVIFGYLNSIAYKLAYGFSDAVMQEMLTLED